MKKCATVVVAAAVIAVIGLVGTTAPASAQDRLAVVTVAAPIYLLPDVTRIPLRTLEVREYLRVRKNEGAWIRVDFQDVQFGLRTGYIQARFVQLVPVERDEHAELVTVDLGLKPPIARPATTSRDGAASRTSTPPARDHHRE